MGPYKKIFVISAVITVALFVYDYQRYIISRPTKQLAFDLALWGGMYTIAIFVVASLMYFCCGKLVLLFRSLFSRRA